MEISPCLILGVRMGEGYNMIHSFKLLGKALVLDVCSGAIHEVDDCVFDLLQLAEVADGKRPDVGHPVWERYDVKEIEQALKDIEELREQGLLFSEDVYQDCKTAQMKQQPVVKALCLHVAHDCNLRCAYCFAGTGAFHGGRSLMDAQTGRAAIDFVIRSSGVRRNIEIDFFGGEPLMNLDVVRDIVAYANEQGAKHEKNFRFTITTNGMLLDQETRDFFNQTMSNVVLSIDGRREINDRVRKSLDGKSVYDTIVPQFLALAQEREQQNYFVRGTFTGLNLDFSKDVLHLADLGFEQISVEPVVEAPESPRAIREEDLPLVFAEYEKLAEEYVKRRQGKNPFSFFHFHIDLTGGPCVLKRIAGCGAGHEYLAVTPDGSLYPCHQLVGEKEFYMGNVKDGLTELDLRDRFRASNIYTKQGCSDCWARFYCSGGCHANAYHFNGDMDKPYTLACEMQKKRIECAIAIEMALQEE